MNIVNHPSGQAFFHKPQINFSDQSLLFLIGIVADYYSASAPNVKKIAEKTEGQAVELLPADYICKSVPVKKEIESPFEVINNSSQLSRFPVSVQIKPYVFATLNKFKRDCCSMIHSVLKWNNFLILRIMNNYIFFQFHILLFPDYCHHTGSFISVRPADYMIVR